MLAARENSRNPTTNSRCLSQSLTVDNINQKFKTMGYVRGGPLHQQARAIERELQEGKERPFEKVWFASSAGDRQQMGQAPITFVRQVLACLAYNPLLNDSSFPEDVKQRVRLLLTTCHGGNIGSYNSHPFGFELVRQHCAEYIAKRDGFPSDWNYVVNTRGSAEAIMSILKMFGGARNGNKQAAFLTPIPCSPIYSALTAQLGVGQVGYYLDEENNWGVNVEELKRAVHEARNKYNVRGIVIINPGNPSGQIFPKETIEMIIRFAYEEDLYILADEVYQDNVYDCRTPFHSVKKIIMQMGEPYNTMQVASVLSTSKGYVGESGVRAGLVEIVNMDPGVFAFYEKSMSVTCASSTAQMTLDCLVNPPKEGEPSYPLWKKERDTVINSLKERASFLVNSFRSIEGVTCNPIQGAVFAFPKLKLPDKAIEEARRRGVTPDVFYASELLQRTGIVVEPGTEFGMPKNSCWLRTTILQDMLQLEIMLKEFKNFHLKFLDEYSNRV